MVNCYNYPHKELWNEKLWEPKRSQLIPLTAWIGAQNRSAHRINALPVEQRRTEGLFDPKANALADPAVLNYWSSKNLHYHCTSMGKSGWVAMVPNEHIGRIGYNADMDTLIVLANADRNDPNWCMYLLERYESYLEAASQQHFALLFIVADDLDKDNDYISITQEAVVIFRLNYKQFYLDVAPVYKAGLCLKDVEGFNYVGGDPDAACKDFGCTKGLDVVGRWQNQDSLICKQVQSPSTSNLGYDLGKLINSEVGRKLAEAVYLEYEYADAEDPALIAHWENMGLDFRFHEHRGERWAAFVPKDAKDAPDTKLPCVCIFQEINAFDPHQAVTGFAYFYQYQKIAAQGECILLYFAQETLDDNDMLCDIIDTAKTLYPIDPSRIYITGHSHNGRFSAEFIRRHPRLVAAVATLGNEPGQLSPKVTGGFFAVTDKQLDIQAATDLPLINISGFNERNSQFPLNSDAPDVRPGQWVALDTLEKRTDSWQRRLRSANCPMRTAEEIAATRNSPDKAERCIGVPADKSETLYLDGSEIYIADIKNNAGKYHLRIVALGNMPHLVTPAMADLSWSYLRRFARDLETGECIELF